MIKKLVISGLIIAIVGALAIGIYYAVQGEGRLGAGQALAQGNGAEQGYRGGRVAEFSAPGYSRAGGNENSGRGGQGNAVARDGTGIPDPQADVSEWLRLSGTVVSVDTGSLTLNTDDGQALTIQLGPSWFWSHQGVSLDPGEQVTALAFEEEGQLQAGQISLDNSGTSLALRDETGRPLWAGRGGGRAQ